MIKQYMKPLSLIPLILCGYAAKGHSAIIQVNTTNMSISTELNAQPIAGDSLKRSGLYIPSTLTISDLNDISKNPADAQSGSAPAISLPEAIIAANNTAGSDVILLEVNKTYTLNTPNNFWFGANALPPITSPITIRGDGIAEGQARQKTDKGAIIERDNSGPKMRLFYIAPNRYVSNSGDKRMVGLGLLTLVNVTVRNGHALGGNGSGGGAGLGGAIFNQGFLSVQSSTFTSNIAEGGVGLTDANFGGGGLGGDASANKGGGFKDSHFIGNEDSAPFQSIFGGNGGPDGSGGFGSIDDNGRNGGGKKASNSTHISFPAFGAGGGLPANALGENGNDGAFGSGGGYGDTGGNGGFGGGGGRSITASISTAGFGGGNGSSIRGGGGAGLGGAIFNHSSAILEITNSTFFGNTAKGGPGANGGSAYGAAIYSLNASLIINLSTLYGNTSTAGSGDVTNGSESSQSLYIHALTGNGVQDGFVNANSSITNSILGNSSGSDPIISFAQSGPNTQNTATFFGKNLIYPSIFEDGNAEVNFTPANSILQIQPFPDGDILADNGGFTSTILPGDNSPAIDAGDNKYFSPSIQFDQRRAIRLKDTNTSDENEAVIDIGAVEAGDNQPAAVNFLDTDEIPDSAPIELFAITNFSDIDTPVIAPNEFEPPLNYNLELEVSNAQFNIDEENVTMLEENGVTFTSAKESDGSIKSNMIKATGPAFFMQSDQSFTLITPSGDIQNLRSIRRTTSIVLDDNLGMTDGDNIELSIKIDDLGNTGKNPTTASQITDESKTFTVKPTPPTVVIGPPNQIISDSSFTLVIGFSEAVNGFEASNISITNGKITSPLTTITENQIFRTSIQAINEGDITIYIPENSVVDKIGLANSKSNTLTVTNDISKPRVSVSEPPSFVTTNDFNLTFSFNEEISGFTDSDIRISNATLSDFTEIDRKTYTVRVTPRGNNAIRFSIRENIASDSAGNGNLPLEEQLIPLQQGSNSSGSWSTYGVFMMLLLLPLRQRKKHVQ